ncbi:unnamed protein product, partial [Linum tenue]
RHSSSTSLPFPNRQPPPSSISALYRRSSASTNILNHHSPSNSLPQSLPPDFAHSFLVERDPPTSLPSPLPLACSSMVAALPSSSSAVNSEIPTNPAFSNRRRPAAATAFPPSPVSPPL